MALLTLPLLSFSSFFAPTTTTTATTITTTTTNDDDANSPDRVKPKEQDHSHQHLSYISPSLQLKNNQLA